MWAQDQADENVLKGIELSKSHLLNLTGALYVLAEHQGRTIKSDCVAMQWPCASKKKDFLANLFSQWGALAPVHSWGPIYWLFVSSV